MATCKHCGKSIKWIKTADGKAIPCDPSPIFFGETQSKFPERFVTSQGTIAYGVRQERPEDGSQLGYVAHRASCSRSKGGQKHV